MKSMIHLTLVTFSAIAGIAIAPTPAKAENADRDTMTQPLTELSDGTHFYGEVADPKQGGSAYSIFTKNGETIRGIYYIYQTGNITCYRGNVRPKAIDNADVATPSRAAYGFSDASPWDFYQNETVDLEGFQKLATGQIPDTAIDEFKECQNLDYR